MSTNPFNATNLADAIRLRDVQWDGDTLLWQAGRTLFAQTGTDAPREILRNTSIRGGVGYGGGGWTVRDGLLVFVGGDGRLYCMDIDYGEPQPITLPWGKAASPAISPDGTRVLYVHTDGENDVLAMVLSDGSDWPRKRHDETDFVMQPVWHPDGERLCYLTWAHPNMPWDETAMWIQTASSPHRRLTSLKTPYTPYKENPESIFGPQFSPDGKYLLYAIDRDDWWRLFLYDLETEEIRRLTSDDAEYAYPAWQQGMRQFGWTGDSRYVYALRNADTRYTLVKIEVATGDQTTIDALRDYTFMERLSVSQTSDAVAMIASSSNIPERVISYHAETDSVRVRYRSRRERVSTEWLPKVEHVTWTAADGETVHGLCYPPTGATTEPPPMVVYAHSGPTSQANDDYNPVALFLASHGFAVLLPNYRGSTGYGRAYREAMRGRWGEIDVTDSADGARAMAQAGKADGDRLVVMGSSSGGLTVLQSLSTMPGFYRAGISVYGVSDMFGLAEDTHKFERYYNDSLLGPLPEAEAVWRERSPLLHADRITDPVALFHGEEDAVVPVQQSVGVAESLARRGIPHMLHIYPGEGHGFRKPETLQHYYATVLDFLRAQGVI